MAASALESTSPILCAEGLVKHYAKRRCVDGLSLALYPGRCLGLLGPNGAGKTTTIELLEGLVAPDAGQILYRGRVLDDAYRQEIGVMFQQTALPDNLTVSELLSLFAALYPDTEPQPHLLERFGLAAVQDQDPRTLSGGQRQRLLLAIALINRPKIVFLDEPTTGLDPSARAQIWQLLREQLARGASVLLSTHDMDEAQWLCDDIIMMDRGAVIRQGRPEQLLAAFCASRVIELPLAVEALIPKHMAFERSAERLRLQSEDLGATLGELAKAQVPLQDLNVRSKTLEDLFLSLAEGSE